MKTKNNAMLILALWLVIFWTDAQAIINNVGVLDNVLARYSSAAASWSAIVTARATWLFWTLALISMVWTFGILALRKADIGEFYAEFIKFTVFTGFFWWLLYNGPTMAIGIMDSLRTIGSNASGTNSVLTPSGIVDIGFNIFSKTISQTSTWAPVDSAIGIIMSGIILVVLALIGVNMLLLLVSGWILAYAGVFFLGFGGSRWTSDMAISYYKTVLNIAAQLFTMVLLVGIGKSFVDQYYNSMSVGVNLEELGVMLIVAVVLLSLVNKVPSLIGQIALGGGAYALGNGFGTGAAMGAAGMAAAAAATGGAVIAAGAANISGGAQALMAAYTKASQNVSSGSDVISRMAGGSADLSQGGGTSNTGTANTSPLSAAMGGESSQPFGYGGNTGAFDSAKDNESIQNSDRNNDTASNAPQPGIGQGEVNAQNAPGQQSSGMAGVLSTVSKVAADTVENLAKGTLEVSKAKVGAGIESAQERIGQTFGGQVASAIKGQGKQEPVFDDNSLAGARNNAVDAESEVAAFSNRSNTQSS